MDNMIILYIFTLTAFAFMGVVKAGRMVIRELSKENND